MILFKNNSLFFFSLLFSLHNNIVTLGTTFVFVKVLKIQFFISLLEAKILIRKEEEKNLTLKNLNLSYINFPFFKHLLGILFVTFF